MTMTGNEDIYIAPPSSLPHDIFRVDEVFQIVGYLTGALPELHNANVGDVAFYTSEAMDKVRNERR